MTAAATTTAGGRLAAQMQQIIEARLRDDKLALPAMPAAATKCLAILRNPEFQTKALVQALEQDPALSAQVLRLANSAAFNYGGGQLTLASAVVRLGAQKVKALLLEAAARQLYESRDRRIATSCRAIFEHSVAVALLARDLAAVGNQSASADAAYMCGLLHDVGKVVVAGLLLEAERMISLSNPGRAWVGGDDWNEAITRSHRAVGLALCERWSLPEQVLKAIRDFGDYDPSDRGAPANFVRFANAVAKREGIYPGSVDQSEAETLVMIGRSMLGIEEDIVAKAAASLRERVKAQMS